MKQVLDIVSVNDYARYVGADILHPDICVVHYDELQHCRHSMNRYGVYGMFLIKESPYSISYGQGQYHFSSGTLMFVAPGQMGGVPDDGEEIHIKGWALLFSPQLIAGSRLETDVEDCHFFSYYENEALRMQPVECRTIETCIKMIRYELREHHGEPRQREIIVSYLQLVFEYSRRFYRRQFVTESTDSDHDLLKRFDELLRRYYKDGLQFTRGLPTVKYCAGEMCLSANYFGDLVRQACGMSAIGTIQAFVMRRALQLLSAGKSISETAYLLGFEYPQHFTRLFRKHFGIPPSRHQELLRRQ